MINRCLAIAHNDLSINKSIANKHQCLGLNTITQGGIMSKKDLEINFLANDNESLEEYTHKCLRNGILYTGQFCNGIPVLIQLQ